MRPTSGHMKNDIDSSKEAKTLIIEDRVLAGGFVQLPKVVLQATSLSRDAKLLYAILLSYAWQATQCFPGYKSLCRDMGAGETTVRQYMAELKVKGLITWRRRGLNQTNVYTLLKLSNADLVRDASKTEVPDHRDSKDKEESEERDLSLRNSKIEHTEKTESSVIRAIELVAEPNFSHHARRRTSEFAGVGDLLAQRRQLRTNGPNPRQGTEPPLQIRATVRQLTDEFGDTTHRASNVTRVARLFARSQMEASAFVSFLYEARSITKDRASDSVMRRPMAYYFTVLEDLLGLLPAREAPDG